MKASNKRSSLTKVNCKSFVELIQGKKNWNPPIKKCRIFFFGRVDFEFENSFRQKIGIFCRKLGQPISQSFAPSPSFPLSLCMCQTPLLCSLFLSMYIYLFLSFYLCRYNFFSLPFILCISLALSFFLCISLQMFLSILSFVGSLYLSSYVCITLSLFLCLYNSVFLSTFVSLYLSFYVCIPVYFFLCLYPSIFLSIFFPVTFCVLICISFSNVLSLPLSRTNTHISFSFSTYVFNYKLSKQCLQITSRAQFS